MYTDYCNMNWIRMKYMFTLNKTWSLVIAATDSDSRDSLKDHTMRQHNRDV